jgi:hypothetical protein
MDWETLIFAGIAARQRKDHTQWELGDLARQVETSYGGHTLENYAEGIGMEHYTLQQYRWVATQYELSVRTDNLSWSHHERVAARDDRLDWLRRAAEAGWSVHQLRSEVHARDIAEAKQREEAVRRRNEEEFLPKVQILAESIPSLAVFEERLERDVGDIRIVDRQTQRSIRNLRRRHYRKEIAQQKQEVEEEKQKRQEDFHLNYQLGQVSRGITHLARLQREGISLRTLAAVLKPLVKADRGFQVHDSINFTVEDVRLAIAYLENVAKELEAAGS